MGRSGSAAGLLLADDDLRALPQDSFNTDPEKEFNDYEWWYEGGASEEPKAGWPISGRDTGSFNKRWGNIMHWMVWPDDPDYYAQRWNDFLAA